VALAEGVPTEMAGAPVVNPWVDPLSL